ncbi:helix-turn-helix domain-containing protein, partial [Listeria ilorinensis]|uniref:Rgg family transcriptional regulator n=1 Tax=Listeria ilorinensis TaxID=2867439 RepID=UPI001EF4D16A
MTKTIGEALKEIRKIRGLTQNQIVTENLTRSSVAKVETNKMNPSYATILEFCGKLGLSLEEVVYYQNGYSVSEKEKLIYEFRNLKLSTYEDPLNTLIKNMRESLKENDDIQIIELKAVLEAVKVFTETDNVALAKEKVTFIWDRLEKQDEWFHFDILILSNIIFVFEPETLINVAEKLMQEIDKFSCFISYNRLKIALTMNIALFLKWADKMDYALDYIERGIALGKENENFIVEYIAYYRKAEYLLYKGKLKEADELYHKAVGFFEFIDNRVVLNDIKNDWVNYH